MPMPTTLEFCPTPMSSSTANGGLFEVNEFLIESASAAGRLNFEPCDPEIPDSFFQALEDFHSGRVVDLDTALNEPPPGA